MLLSSMRNVMAFAILLVPGFIPIIDRLLRVRRCRSLGRIEGIPECIKAMKGEQLCLVRKVLRQ